MKHRYLHDNDKMLLVQLTSDWKFDDFVGFGLIHLEQLLSLWNRYTDANHCKCYFIDPFVNFFSYLMDMHTKKKQNDAMNVTMHEKRKKNRKIQNFLIFSQTNVNVISCSNMIILVLFMHLQVSNYYNSVLNQAM